MPQASDELRSKMAKYFGDPVDDSGPWNFLSNAGFRQKGGWITHPSAYWDSMSEKERDCLQFLADEWDYAYDFSNPATQR